MSYSNQARFLETQSHWELNLHEGISRKNTTSRLQRLKRQPRNFAEVSAVERQNRIASGNRCRPDDEIVRTDLDTFSLQRRPQFRVQARDGQIEIKYWKRREHVLDEGRAFQPSCRRVRSMYSVKKLGGCYNTEPQRFLRVRSRIDLECPSLSLLLHQHAGVENYAHEPFLGNPGAVRAPRRTARAKDALSFPREGSFLSKSGSSPRTLVTGTAAGAKYAMAFPPLAIV